MEYESPGIFNKRPLNSYYNTPSGLIQLMTEQIADPSMDDSCLSQLSEGEKGTITQTPIGKKLAGAEAKQQN